ncbi:uncharacterized protein LOC126980579 [Eriocheir sinensis]|uniref:uncharacterized protein LOC126980579 n=1 Tax=Eriocheir sinensis TaxID=95602 RepID=UPI0021C6399C|nr:uncharacterized protein LOC126980579 [Eriocheir sinensis]XP_050686621.1 uncharacterized protein LOC126980579 [Eriocheir sinensis]XP_050686631.1 uncharacterized protein LOC126980579 [Eriocheir sinensis]
MSSTPTTTTHPCSPLTGGRLRPRWAWRLSGLAVFTLCLGVASRVPAGEAATPGSAGTQRGGRVEKTPIIVTIISNTTEVLAEGQLETTESSTKFTLFSEQNAANFTLPDSKEEESLGSPSLENVSGGAKAMAGHAECVVETPFPPDEYEPPMYQCPDADSFWMLGTQLGDQRVSVRVAKVNGGLALPPTASLKLVGLDLQQTNTTHFINLSQALTSLESLHLDGNPDFDASSLLQLGQLPSLNTLQLAGSAQTTLSGNLWQLLKGMPSLQVLYVSSTGLHHLPLDTFQQNPKLQILEIGGNEFISIIFDQGLIQQLTRLNISGCHLKNLEIEVKSAEASQTQHLSIDLSKNHLTSLPASFMNYVTKNFVHLNIKDNLWNESCKVCSLYHLWRYGTDHSDRVDGAQNVNCFQREEALKSCGWEECPSPCTCDAETKTVDCRNTGLMAVPHVAPSNAAVLLLENNSLFDMRGIESPVWCNLNMVNADNNRMTAIIPPDAVGKGTCTCFDDDEFYEEEWDCYPQSLKKLSLSHNKIKNLSHSDCHLLYSLEELHLSGNEVKHLGSHVCSSFQHLEVLSLDHNRYNDLKEEDVAPYPKLRKLNISFNYLPTLPYRILELMPKLTVLDVSNNRLRQLSENTSTPDTPFTSSVSSLLEKLDFSNNSLELIKPVLSLKQIPFLKKLSLDNNPWQCSCETIKDLAVKVFEELKRMAMVKAVQTIRCHQPADLKDVLINDPRALQICEEAESSTNVFSAVVGTMIILAFIGFMVYLACKKSSAYVRNELNMSTSCDETFRRRYNVVVVHDWEDNEIVKRELVDPLRDLSYTVAWNENVFPPGQNTNASIERAVEDSRRMLVVASKNFMEYDRGEQIIRRGLSEEDRTPGFKVLALVLDDLPKELKYPALYDIVVKRNPVYKNSRDYITKICDFLPAPGTSQYTIWLTETDVNSFLWQQIEKMERRDKKRASKQQAPLHEIFTFKRSDGCGSSVEATYSTQSFKEAAKATSFNRNQSDRCTTRF